MYEAGTRSDRECCCDEAEEQRKFANKDVRTLIRRLDGKKERKKSFFLNKRSGKLGKKSSSKVDDEDNFGLKIC